MRSRYYHRKLSIEEPKPKCSMCELNSMYYCNMNDQYFCEIHVIGHDDNENWFLNTKWVFDKLWMMTHVTILSLKFQKK